MPIVFINHLWGVTVELAPWLLLGCAIAGAMHVFMPENVVRRHLGTPGLGNVLKATILGIPLPLCSCGVIPAAVGLKKDGASDAAAVGFLVSTPQTGIDSITVSAAFLGVPFAIFKVFSAFITGLLAGFFIEVTEGKPETERHPVAVARLTSRLGFFGKIREAFHFALDELLAGFALWIVVGIVVSALISTWLPAGSLANNPLATGLTGIFLMLLVSLPLYVCATGSVPVAAALVAAGMPTGAALVFLMAGPATNAATLGTVFREFGRRVAFIYLFVIAIGSVGLGIAYHWLFGDFATTLLAVEDHPSLWHTFAALFLVAFMVNLGFRKAVRRIVSGRSRPTGCSHQEKAGL